MNACSRWLMNISSRTFISLFFVLIALPGVAVGASPCPGLEFVSELEPGLAANEKSLVCPTDKKGTWSHIPPNQRRFHLIRFLQTRGHNTPEFRITPDGTLTVMPGPISRVRTITVRVSGEMPQTQWNWLGNPITPELLDEIEGSLEEELRKKGFPCADARATVPKPENGEIFVDVSQGRAAILSYASVSLSGELQEIYTKSLLSRFYAFRDRQSYDENLLTLTTQRMEQSGIVDSGYFLSGCDVDELNQLQLRGSISPPRLVTVGVGVDTEGILKAKAQWRHSRLGANASSIEFSVLASKFLQSFQGNMNWYISKDWPRFYLQPDLEFRRNSEQHYESYTLVASILPSYTWDTNRERIRLNIGPSVELTKTVRGTGLGLSLLPMLKATVGYLTHDLELHLDQPTQGTLAQFSVFYSDQKLLSDISFVRFQLSGKHLWNLGNLKPARYVLGVRFAFGATVGWGGTIPDTYLFFLGGSDSLRGFSRLELPGNGQAAQTQAYVGIEQRFLRLLPWQLQPIVFMDFGAVGSPAFSLQGPTFGSPGLGIRWDSPIGAIRTTIAHGLALGTGSVPYRSHWQFYIGFGEEF